MKRFAVGVMVGALLGAVGARMRRAAIAAEAAPIARMLPRARLHADALRDEWLRHPRSWEREHRYAVSLVDMEFKQRAAVSGQDEPGQRNVPPPSEITELANDLRERAHSPEQRARCERLDAQIENLQHSP